MLNIEVKRMVHEASQPWIEEESKSLTNHMKRVGVDWLTKKTVDSLLLALKDKSALVTELYEENDKLKEELKEMAK